MDTIGEKIRVLRKNNGLSQEDLALELGLSRQTVHKWEKDAMQPSADNLKSLCDFFKVSPNYFLSNDEHKTIEEVAVTTDNMVVAADNTKSKKRYIICSVISIILFLALIFSILITIGVGCVVYSVNYGHVVISMLIMEEYVFYLFLSMSLILLAINVVMIFYIKKYKVKFCLRKCE